MVARRAAANASEVVRAAITAADITLQINLCAGDLPYGRQIVEALVATHRPDVREVLIVADGCRPGSTPLLCADRRFPPAEFAGRVRQLRDLCAQLEAAGTVDRVVWLEPDPRALRRLNARYAGWPTSRSHDHLGHAFSAYFLGWDAPRTRYVAHFDADILLRQEPGFSWLRAAVAALQADPSLLGASPRIAPPPAADQMVHVEAPGSGWLPSWPLERVSAGWRSPWFSTRCHVMDRDRLTALLPLVTKQAAHRDRRARAIDRWLQPLYGMTRLPAVISARIPPFPLPPEVLLHEAAQARGFGCLYLEDPRAWFIHPDTKPGQFVHLLPRLVAAISERGACPPEQRGIGGLRYPAWEAFLA